MTALPVAKAEALRFRIWAYAAPREWNVTVKEIAEAIGVPWRTVKGITTNNGWSKRLRVETLGAGNYFAPRAVARRAEERHVAYNILAGRVEAGTL